MRTLVRPPLGNPTYLEEGHGEGAREKGTVGGRAKGGTRKRSEEGALRGRKAGEKYKTLIFVIYNALEYFQKQEPVMLVDLRSASSETSEPTSK